MDFKDKIDPMIDEVRHQAMRKLEENGKKEELKRMLRNRLNENQFDEKVAELCKNYMKGKNIETLTVDEILRNVTPEAHRIVPDSVKRELLTAIKGLITGDQQ